MNVSKKLFGGVVFAVAMSAMTGVATVALKAEARAEKQARATATSKGVLKTIDDSSVVIVPSDNKKVEASFAVSASTTRSGALAAGDQVTVTYYFEAGKRVATAVVGKVAK